MDQTRTISVPPIDLDAFRLSMQAAGIEEIVEPTLAMFAEESGGLVAAITEAVAAGDAETARRAAHALKGSAGNVRARELSRTAESIEEAAEQGALDSLPALVDAARTEHESVVTYLRQKDLVP